jgi:hypothetical protein
MEPDDIPPEARATLEVFETLRQWLAVASTTVDPGVAIPEDEPSRQNLGDLWKDVRFDVPEEPTKVDWMGWMQTSFAHQYASDVYQDVGTDVGSEQSSRSKSQPKQGA